MVCFCLCMYSPLNLFEYWTLNNHYYYIKCLAPLDKSDYIALSFKLVTSTIMKINGHEANRLNYQKADYNKMNLLLKWHNGIHYSNISHYRICGGFFYYKL